MKSNISLKKIIKERIIISCLLIVALVSMSIGYAVYNDELSFMGVVVVDSKSDILISDIQVSDSFNAQNYGIHYSKVSGDEVSLNSTYSFIFTSSKESSTLANYITYNMKIINLSDKSYVFKEVDSLVSDDFLSVPVITGIREGDVISSGEKLSITVTYYSDIRIDEDMIFDANVNFKFTLDESYATLSDVATNVDNKELIFSDDLVSVRLEMLSSYSYSFYYTLEINDDRYEIVDSDGNKDLKKRILIPGVSIVEDIFIKSKEEYDEDHTTELFMNIDGIKKSIGTLLLINDTRERYSDILLTYLKEENDIYFHITNNNDEEDISLWTAYIYLNPDMNVISFESNFDMVVYDPLKHLIKLSSKGRDEKEDLVIKKQETLVLNPIKLNVGTDEIEIDRIVIYKDQEEYNESFNYPS